MRAPLPLCAHCHDQPVKRPRNRYCSMSCRSSATDNLRAAGDTSVRGRTRGHATQRQQYFARVEARLRQELAPLADRIPMADLLPIAARIYKRAYDLGWHVAYNKQRREAA